jgi:hypothetical protein
LGDALAEWMHPDLGSATPKKGKKCSRFFPSGKKIHQNKTTFWFCFFGAPDEPSTRTGVMYNQKWQRSEGHITPN